MPSTMTRTHRDAWLRSIAELYHDTGYVTPFSDRTVMYNPVTGRLMYSTEQQGEPMPYGYRTRDLHSDYVETLRQEYNGRLLSHERSRNNLSAMSGLTRMRNRFGHSFQNIDHFSNRRAGEKIANLLWAINLGNNRGRNWHVRVGEVGSTDVTEQSGVRNLIAKQLRAIADRNNHNTILSTQVIMCTSNNVWVQVDMPAVSYLFSIYVEYDINSHIDDAPFTAGGRWKHALHPVAVARDFKLDVPALHANPEVYLESLALGASSACKIYKLKGHPIIPDGEVYYDNPTYGGVPVESYFTSGGGLAAVLGANLDTMFARSITVGTGVEPVAVGGGGGGMPMQLYQRTSNRYAEPVGVSVPYPAGYDSEDEPEEDDEYSGGWEDEEVPYDGDNEEQDEELII